MQGLVLIDGRNVAYAAQSTAKLHVGGAEVQAIYGFVRVLRMIKHRYQQLKPIVLWDGKSWRHGAYSAYKATRTKDDTKSAQKLLEERAALNKQIPIIYKAVEALGVEQMIADNYEADDLAGLLVKQNPGKKILLISGDKDWVQLVGPNVTWLDPIRDIRITPANIAEKLGVETPEQWLEYRVLKGDVSDNIPGVGGIGDVGAKELLREYGSVTGFLNQYHDGTLKDVPKKYIALATEDERMERFRRNMILMNLQHPAIPAPINLRVIKGEYSKERFEHICRRLAFHSILRELEAWLVPFGEVYEQQD